VSTGQGRGVEAVKIADRPPPCWFGQMIGDGGDLYFWEDVNH
jgi:hypothetical protein